MWSHVDTHTHMNTLFFFLLYFHFQKQCLLSWITSAGVMTITSLSVGYNPCRNWTPRCMNAIIGLLSLFPVTDFSSSCDSELFLARDPEKGRGFRNLLEKQSSHLIELFLTRTRQFVLRDSYRLSDWQDAPLFMGTRWFFAGLHYTE